MSGGKDNKPNWEDSIIDRVLPSGIPDECRISRRHSDTIVDSRPAFLEEVDPDSEAVRSAKELLARDAGFQDPLQPAAVKTPGFRVMPKTPYEAALLNVCNSTVFQHDDKRFQVIPRDYQPEDLGVPGLMVLSMILPFDLGRILYFRRQHAVSGLVQFEEKIVYARDYETSPVDVMRTARDRVSLKNLQPVGSTYTKDDVASASFDLTEMLVMSLGASDLEQVAKAGSRDSQAFRLAQDAAGGKADAVWQPLEKLEDFTAIEDALDEMGELAVAIQRENPRTHFDEVLYLYETIAGKYVFRIDGAPIADIRASGIMGLELKQEIGMHVPDIEFYAMKEQEPAWVVMKQLSQYSNGRIAVSALNQDLILDLLSCAVPGSDQTFDEMLESRTIRVRGGGSVYLTGEVGMMALAQYMTAQLDKADDTVEKFDELEIREALAVLREE